jgi:hypothetical protein
LILTYSKIFSFFSIDDRLNLLTTTIRKSVWLIISIKKIKKKKGKKKIPLKIKKKKKKKMLQF